MRKILKAGLIATVTIGTFLGIATIATANNQPEILFPVDVTDADKFNWVDTWGAPRPGGRTHQGVDVFGPKMTKLVAVESGHITWGRFNNSKPLGGNFLELTGNSGRRYYYTHLNNDTPGTDDSNASCTQAFSAEICQQVGSFDGEVRAKIPVVAGDFIGYNGDSGNAETTPPHIHFEILIPNGAGTNNGDIYDIAVRNDDWDEVNPTPSVDAAYATLKNQAPVLSKIADTNSSEAKVIRLYRAFFNRTPDNKGMNYWVGQVKAGKSLDTIAESFSQSGEFATRFSSTTNSQYVEILYGQVLERGSDNQGKSYWISQLNSGKVDRYNIVVYFSEGAELKTKTTYQVESALVWLNYKNRLPTAVEADSWKQVRKTKSVIDSINQLV